MAWRAASPWRALGQANAECHRASVRWAQLRGRLPSDVLAELDEKEVRHLEQTVYRVNLLVFLYSYMRRIAHSTELGILLGAITYLLDFVYDHGDHRTEKLHAFERAVTSEHPPESDDPLEVGAFGSRPSASVTCR